ncbi:hypothetical protein [Clostridium sp.]|uniref:hypothetical protein n=1 Tax=Clostridium sp. TaxID=1506 RepID=UPI00321792DC
MDNKVELKVNVINQLKLFRQSTFKDVLCFLDEDIQNAQRAKAKEVKIYTKKYDNRLIIENDGSVLENPQSLFSIAESGWDNDVKKNENPFGMGFFSNISVSNLVEIISGSKHIIFDVDKMINTRDCSLEVLEYDGYYDGFKLILNNFDYDSIYSFEIEERLERLGKYIHELDIYYNDRLQEKKDLTEVEDGCCFSTKIEDVDVKGWITISSNYSFSSSQVGLYYKGRFVSNLEKYPYLKGDLHINDRVLNLTSPDRKDIIKDKKYSDFIELIDMYIKDFAHECYKNGEDDDIEEYCNAINYYIDKNELLQNTKFSVFKGEDKISYLKNIAVVRNENKNIKTFKAYNFYLDNRNSVQGESQVEEIYISEPMDCEVEEEKGVVFEKGGISSYDSKIIKPEIKNKDLNEKDGEFISKNSSQPVFWMAFEEIERYEYKFNIIKHYGFALIVTRNKVEESILKTVNKEFNVFHISELQEEIEFHSTISNTELSIKERRALMILDMISRIFEFDHNVFSIGNVMTVKIVTIDNTDIRNEVIDENVVIVKDSESNKVYVDRSIIELSKIDDRLDSKMSLQDVQFILQNIKDISDAIYLLTYKEVGKIKDIIIDAIANII